jgi:hypothetical protein
VTSSKFWLPETDPGRHAAVVGNAEEEEIPRCQAGNDVSQGHRAHVLDREPRTGPGEGDASADDATLGEIQQAARADRRTRQRAAGAHNQVAGYEIIGIRAFERLEAAHLDLRSTGLCAAGNIEIAVRGNHNAADCPAGLNREHTVDLQAAGRRPGADIDGARDNATADKATAERADGADHRGIVDRAVADEENSAGFDVGPAGDCAGKKSHGPGHRRTCVRAKEIFLTVERDLRAADGSAGVDR